MKSFVTSYSGLFTHRSAEAPPVDRIEIPLIQRDYAQGRAGVAVGRIRESFLAVLHRAVTLGEHVSLDFVYGDVEAGTLRPLDGQQRLTTLFLLHWYLAFRADRVDEAQGWKQLTYATRPSARLFCQRLVECTPPPGIDKPSVWIEDQAWHLHTWQHDPTIQSMLVMIDAIHQRFIEDDCAAAWERLVDPQEPAISFHLLPIEQMGLSEDLYIKMNSRGKPLTPFENFKARFEQTLEASCPERVDEFALKVDGVWADLLWPYHGVDFIVDDEFLHYFSFVTEVCEWREGRLDAEELDPRAERIFGPSNSKAAEHLEFLFRAFDTWVDADITAAFGSIFATEPAAIDSSDTAKVVLFGQQAGLGVNLFSACCRNYGDTRGRNRVFSLSHTILLYAVLLHRLHETSDFARRLRVVRNLIEASGNELRLEKMPSLLADVEQIVVAGALDGVGTFNQAQVADERLKAVLRTEHPELEPTLFYLEDHVVLRGSLAAFDLDAATFNQRADAFHQIFSDASCWPALTGALLAAGDYSRQMNSRVFQLGSASNEAPWRELLTGAARSHLNRTREVLGRLLDEVAAGQHNTRECLDSVQANWLQAREQSKELDWRYYFVKYPAMREGKSGIYVGSDGALAYTVCMLNKRRMNSWYRDPCLLAIWRVSGVEGAVRDPWFTGYETQPRWMHLEKSGVEIRCVDAGFALRPPTAADQAESFLRACKEHGVDEEHLLAVPQVEIDGVLVDSSDRVRLGADLLRGLVDAGL